MKTVKGRVMEKVATSFWSEQLGFWDAMRLVTWREDNYWGMSETLLTCAWQEHVMRTI